jgi:4-hydroxybenzoate polyprenyltransferase
MGDSKQRSLFDTLTILVTVSRPIFWIVLPLLYIGGVLFTQNSLETLTWTTILTAIWLSFPFCIFLYGINDVYDLESDLKNPRKGGIQGLRLHPDNHPLIVKTSILVSVGLLIIVSLDFSFSKFVTALLLILSSYLYSAPPIRLKEIPVIDSLTNGLLYVLFPFYLGFFEHSSLSDTSLKILLTVLGAAGVHAYTSTLDVTSDKEAGDRTFAVAFGPRITLAFSFLVTLVALLFAGYETLLINTYLITLLCVYGITLIFPSRVVVSKFGSMVLYGGFCITALVYVFLQFL